MSNHRVKLSKTVVVKAEPREREYVLWDSRLPGFGLRVRPSGARSFVYAYRTSGGRAGKYQRVTLDTDNAEVAFAKAKELAGKVHGGIDPAAAKASEKADLVATKNVMSLAQVLDAFVEARTPDLAPSTAAEYRRHCERFLKPELGHHKVDALQPPHVAAFYAAHRTTPTQAASAVRTLSSAMSWAMEVGLRPASVNPAAIRMKASRKRERLLSDTEVSKIMSALDQLEANGTVNRNLALAVRLMFATAARAGEVCKLEWQHVDFEVGTLTWPDSKTGFLRKPIVAEARRLLTEAKAHRVVGCRWVCPQTDPAKPMRIETLRLAFKAAMTLAGVEANERASLHLIRHAVASRIYSDPSVPLPIAMRIVGHANVGTAMRYAHVSQEDVLKVAQKSEKRRNDAIEAAGREIAKAAKARKVVEIGTRR